MASQAWCQKEKVKNKTWFVRILLTVFYRTVEVISDMVFWFIHKKREKTILPAIDNLLLLESASSLARKIRTQKVTSEEVVNVFIGRIKAVNPIINCCVDNRFELALEEAKKVDQLIQSGEKDEKTLELETPFLGVPFTIKDCFSVTGLRYTAGLVKRKDIIGQFDSDVVALMKKAGAIILAVTNVSELCMWWESNNNIYGRSRNPYDTNRIVGGSSGGEAALLSAGGSPFGIGSDIGGSIRMPAFFNGIFGHKPTRGIVSNYEQQPVAEKVLQTFLVTGPMSRFCSDLMPMYRILAADNINKLKLDEKVSVSKLRYFYMESFGNIPLLSRVHPDLKEAQSKVVRHFQRAYNIPVEKGQVSVGLELLKFCVGQSNYTLPGILMGLFEKFSLPSTHPTAVKMLAMCDELRRDIQELLGDDGILLVPPHPTPALYHNQPLTKPLNAAYTAIFNVLGFPVTQVPLGLGSWGVPLGVQVVGNLHNDHLTLAVAAELERAFGGWVSPSPVTSEEVVIAFINRIKAVNPIINCVVDNRFQLALKEAQSADKLIQSGEKDEETLELETPFLGVPFTIKDCFSVEGLHYTSGLVKRKDFIGQFDSDVVILMKKAGAIMLAITNVPELCMWWESLNNVYGRSRNPYDINRTVGGSSGGEAGLLASGGSPFGIGSDIGGSIRLPAFFNGIFGHKPTSGIVSNHEQQPVAGQILQTYLVTGPMSRFCSDLLPMYRVLAADNVKKLKLDEKVSLSKIRYFYVEHFGRNPLLGRVHPDLKEAQMRVVQHIQRTYNVPVQKMKFPKLYHAMEMWSVKMTSAGNPPFVAELAMRKGQISLIAEFLKYCVGQCEHTLYALAMGIIGEVVPFFNASDVCEDDQNELLGDDGVLLCPPNPTASFYHNQSLTRPFNFAYVAIFNIFGFPITQVPLGLGSWGVPLGVQVIGNLHNDHLTLAVAAELEREFGGWVSPSPIS
uniref:Amidase domain-containing protein n=1 Tax=Daphnia galeata TaxID=27404 RepID=A0A8J2RND1_9CRUS|nr:unnamed protein product [Daphnia galeata]